MSGGLIHNEWRCSTISLHSWCPPPRLLSEGRAAYCEAPGCIVVSPRLPSNTTTLAKCQHLGLGRTLQYLSYTHTTPQQMLSKCKKQFIQFFSMFPTYGTLICCLLDSVSPKCMENDLKLSKSKFPHSLIDLVIISISVDMYHTISGKYVC